MNLRHLAILSATALAFVLGSMTTAAAKLSASDLVGVWSGEQAFGPAFAGNEVVISVSGRSWSARVGALRGSASGQDYTLTFDFGNGNKLRLRYADNDLAGQWIQPISVSTGARFATPVVFSGPPGGPWRGRIVPFVDVQHVDLIVQRASDGTLSAFVRNPEENFGARIGSRAVSVAGDRVTLSRKDAPDITGTFDAAARSIAFHFDPFPGTFVLRKVRPADAAATYSVPLETGDGWKTASPAEVGMDEQKIRDVLKSVGAAATSTRSPYIQSILIARHGKLVLDQYFNGFDRGRPHDVRSAGKSVATLLIGAAMRDHPSLSPNTPAYTLFPQYVPFAHPDPRKNQITVGNLMSMSSGLACDDNDDASPGLEDAMQSQTAQPDWYKFTLDLPLVSEPGTKATYCSAGINLLGGVVTKATGSWLPEYFYDRFAKPMQFGPYAMWLTPPPLDTAYMAGGDHFLPRDFLKFGQLFLNRGFWNGSSVLDDKWLQASIEPRSGLNNPGDYGYGWHLFTYVVNGQTYKAFNAGGNGGQLLIVLPRLDMAVMITAANYGQYPVWLSFVNDLVPKQILPAVRP